MFCSVFFGVFQAPIGSLSRVSIVGFPKVFDKFPTVLVLEFPLSCFSRMQLRTALQPKPRQIGFA